MGRLSKFTDRRKKNILKALYQGSYREVAYVCGGIGKTTFFNWLNMGEAQEEGEYRDFLNAVNEAEAHGEMRAVKTISKAMEKGDWKAAIIFLERKYHDRWGRRDRQEISGPDGGPIPITHDYSKLSRDELNTLKELERKALAGTAAGENGRGDLT